MTSFLGFCQYMAILLLCVAGIVECFQSTIVVVHEPRTFERDYALPWHRGGRFCRLRAAAATDNDNDNPEPVYLSDNQIATLRKEASKRIANQRMPTLFLQESETNGDFAASIAEICTALTTSELVQVRGLSRDSKKQIRNVADLLAMALGVEMGKDVNLVECKGHAAVYYCPVEDDRADQLDLPKIKLFTSVGKKNEWTRKPKSVRDNRGQIIPGLYE